MKVRIKRNPTGVVDGISLCKYQPGRTYDLPWQLADYLVAEGYAYIEMRQRQRSSRQRRSDRRRRDIRPIC